MYWVKAPWWLQRLFDKRLIWKVPADAAFPAVYLTFDDGPHPVATPFVLEQLAKYDASATFFCIGKCVAEFPAIYHRIREARHAIGNHTHNHLNGWKTPTEAYIGNITTASRLIDSHIFRPPYGRITRAQVRKLAQADEPWKIYMWDVLSADFDTNLTPEKCLENVLFHLQPGSIAVFHDSNKAWSRMQYVLPRVLEYCREKGWACLSLPE